MKAAAIGLRVKSGRAIAVVVCEPGVALRRVELKLAETTLQPYHPFMDLPWEKADAAVRPAAWKIRQSAARLLDAFVRELRADNLDVRGVAIVGSSVQEPARMKSSHIRAHAAEGRLFRQAFEHAAESRGLVWRAFPDNDTGWWKAIPPVDSGGIKPWRVEEKSAALAARLLLDSADPVYC